MITHLHPMLVHFPIALLFLYVLIETGSVALRRPAWRATSYILLLFGVIGGIAAIGAGWLAEEAAEKSGVPEALIETHEQLGIATLVLFGGLLVWRTLRRRAEPGRATAVATIAIGVLGLVGLSATGYYGGQLVYDFGAGVTQTTARVAADTPRGGGASARSDPDPTGRAPVQRSNTTD